MRGDLRAACCAVLAYAGGRRVLWVSTSNDLRFDARRDLDDLGVKHIGVYPMKRDSVPKGDLGILCNCLRGTSCVTLHEAHLVPHA